jgi:hypothetical protein
VISERDTSVDEHLSMSLMTARGLLQSAAKHLERVEELARSGDLAGALNEINAGAARRSRDAFEQLAAAADRLRQLGGAAGSNT